MAVMPTCVRICFSSKSISFLRIGSITDERICVIPRETTSAPTNIAVRVQFLSIIMYCTIYRKKITVVRLCAISNTTLKIFNA